MPWRTQEIMNQRTEFALRALQTDNFRALCREYGISTRVGYKWRARLLQHGVEGMGELSRRPHRCPEALDEEQVCGIVLLKQRHPHWGPRKLREIYRKAWGQAPSESSFKRVLERSGLTEKRRIRAVQETGRLVASGYKASAPNDGWSVDLKGWWHDGEGRAEPLTVRDEYSRYVLELRALPDARTSTVQACFERLFERHGLPKVIRSDNGPPFASTNGLLGLSRLSAWWIANGIELERSRPGCPQDNGAHERLHRDIARELEATGYAERQAAFDVWRREFNEERPHEALEMQVPAAVYRASERSWKGTPEEISYPRMLTRKVNMSGLFSHQGQRIFVTTALAGWHLGLSPCDDGSYEVYFSRLALGRFEPHTGAFIPSIKRPAAPTSNPQTST